MYKNTIFNEEEWKKLQFSIPIIFYAIAGADHKIDRKEKVAMKNVLENDNSFKSELICEILSSIDDEPEKLLNKFLEEGVKVKDGLEEIRRIVDSKLEHSEAMGYKKTLIAIGAYIGDASGKFLQTKLSYEEEEELHKIGYALDVPVKELMMTKILERLMAKVKEK